MKKVIKFIIYIFGPLILGTVVAIISGFETYKVINKPPLSPPGIIFPIAWSILYILMGISFYIVNKDELHKNINYYLQLIINFIWPILFFKLKLFFISSLWIVLLIYFVIKMISDYKEVNKKAGYLQIPYFLWLLFALYLNIGVAILN